MTGPLKHSDISKKPGERTIDKPELPPQGLLVEQSADCEVTGGGQLKVGRHRDFEVFCDEPEYLGGGDKHPQPLTYICMGVGFWLLTQLARYAHMMKIKFEKASCRVEMDYLLSGSVLKGTVQSKCTETRTFFKVESAADPEKIAKVVRLAKQGCFAENMIKEAVPLKSEVELNGEKITFEG